MIEALLIKLGLSSLVTVFRAVPRWVWWTLLAVVVILAAYAGHQHKVKQAFDFAYAQGETASDKAWQKRLDQAKADAQAWKDKYEAKANSISTEAQKANAQDTARIHDTSDALRLRGPGQASTCPGPVDRAVLAQPAGQHDSAGQGLDAGRSQLPTEDWAAVPWAWLVSRAEEADLNRAEVLTWRQWYADQSKLNSDQRASLPDK